MKVKQFIFNAFQENCYILSDEVTRRCVIIDPGISNAFELKSVTDYIDHEKLTLERVLLTHCHIDHVMGTGFLADAYAVPICGPVDDAERLPDAEQQSRLFGVPIPSKIAPITHNLNEGDRLKIGDSDICVYDIPGHSNHGLCFYLPNEKMLFSGDVLFYGSIGRSDFGPSFGCDGEALVDGIRCKLMSLPPDTTVYPGHGPLTTIGQEIQINPYF